MFDQSKRGRLYRQSEQLRVIKEAARAEMPTRADELALQEMILDAEIRVALVYERLAKGPSIGKHTVNGQVVDDRSSHLASAADGRRRVAENFKKLQPLVGLSGEAWIQYMKAFVSRSVDRAGTRRERP